MSTDDEAARQARARRLRGEIEKLATPATEGEEKEPEASSHTPNPRDWIQEKMRKLDKERKAEG